MSKGLGGQQGVGGVQAPSFPHNHPQPPSPSLPQEVLCPPISPTAIPPPPYKPPNYPHVTPKPPPPKTDPILPARPPNQNLLPLHDADGCSADGVVEAEAEQGAGGAMDPPCPLSLVLGVGGAAVPLPRGGPTIRHPPVAFGS